MDASKRHETPCEKGALATAERLRARFSERSCYASIGMADIRRLCCIVDLELDAHERNGNMPMMVSSADMTRGDDGAMKAAFVRVSGPYFDDREAVSFNADGFIGLAGWADERNSRPFLRAFDIWVRTLAYEHREPGR